MTLDTVIAENSIGDSKSSSAQDAGSMRGISLPPLPTDNIADADDEGEWSKTPVATHAHSGSVSKKSWGLGFWSSPTVPAGSSSTVKTVSNDTAVSHSSVSSVPSTKAPTILAPTTAISSFVSRWRSGTTSSPSPPASSTTSPKTTSSPSAFNWYSGTPPTPQANDNYTPVPVPGTLKRRPSAYSSPSYESDNSSIRRKEITGANIDRSLEPEVVDMYKRDTITGPIGNILFSGERAESPDTLQGSSVENLSSLHHPYLDSTPSLTDTETMGTNPSSGSENEPESPYSARVPLTPSRKNSAASVEKGKVPISPQSSTVKISIQRRASSASSRSSIQEQDVPAVPPLPLCASPRMPEFTKVPPSPKMKGAIADRSTASSPKFSPASLNGQKRVRSRAPSAVILAGAAMETIDESAIEKEKRTSLSK